MVLTPPRDEENKIDCTVIEADSMRSIFAILIARNANDMLSQTFILFYAKFNQFISEANATNRTVDGMIGLHKAHHRPRISQHVALTRLSRCK